jgi:transposase InsO family protein/transposase-like protein
VRTKSWRKQSRKELVMRRHYSAAQKQAAIDLYHQGMSLRGVEKRLGYPPKSCLHRWLKAPEEQQCRKYQGRKLYTYALKVEAVCRFYSGERIKAIADRLGIRSPYLIPVWAKRGIGKGAGNVAPEEDPTGGRAPDTPDTIEDLKARNHGLELENALMRETIKLLKKDPGVDQKSLSNPEKAILVDALRRSFSLSEIMEKLKMASSSYYYSRAALSRPDKYAGLRVKVKALFLEHRAVYGARRIWFALKNVGIKVSEKVVRRIMREDRLVVICQHKRRPYSSYGGEISPAPANLIQRDFHAAEPNQKWLTDITEMKAADAKVYLSPVLDCFDGKVVSFTVGLHPDEELANTMLKDAIATLPQGKHPIIHSDRGCHYRWPKWIQITRDAHLVRSMSKKGCSPDNAAAEGFFGRLKNEMYYGFEWTKRPARELMQGISEYIAWYNGKRLKASLGGMSPNQYRKSLGYAI